jgi:hypothetical protein
VRCWCCVDEPACAGLLVLDLLHATFRLTGCLYCGLDPGHGEAFVYRYWYLAIFYITPWLTFIPTAFLLNGGERGAAERV